MPCQISYEDDTVELETAEELFVALELTPIEADKEILSQIEEGILDLVKTDEQFLLILEKVLDTRGASKAPYLKCFGTKLSQVVTKGSTLFKALSLLANESDQEYFLHCLGQEAIRKCICNINDLVEALTWLYGKMDILFINLIGWDFVLRFVNSGRSLGALMKVLSQKEEQELLERMGWQAVIDCIQDPEDLMAAFIGLEQQSDRLLIDKLVEFNKLQIVIPSVAELERVCRRGLGVDDIAYLQEIYQKILAN
ncbi:hypothetical protein [Microseira wollei]|uniref:Uncharacterized protein n=1 Tax=Microseira wollei NIES-4236 TaxID=2530354 RepID=A0AAV3X4U0_9CYAN|nr:hypothetical protein [Microseira wollei]GET37129.1 hypothetical protein MiSe_18820 [Microseira wollei NIES-4236]